MQYNGYDFDLAQIKNLFIFSAFLVIVFCSLTWAGERIKKQKDVFLYYFTAEDSQLVDRLHQNIIQALQRVNYFFPIDARYPVTIIIVRSRDDYNRYTRNKIPEWSQAVAFPEQRTIILLIENAEQLKRSPEILMHELIHVLLHDYLQRSKMPRWLEEGLAQYLSGKSLQLYEKNILARASVHDKIIPLMAMDSVLDMGPVKARLAYIQALNATAFLLEEYGLKKGSELLERMARGVSFERALMKTYGFDFLDFEIAWNEYVSGKYRWLYFLDMEHWVMILIGLLFVVAVIYVFLKNRRKLKEWEVEELD